MSYDSTALRNPDVYKSETLRLLDLAAGGSPSPSPTSTSAAPIGSPLTYSAIALEPAGNASNTLTIPANVTSAMVQAIEPIYYTIGNPVTNPTDIDFQLGAGEQMLLSPLAAIQAFRAKSQSTTTAARVRIQFLG